MLNIALCVALMLASGYVPAGWGLLMLGAAVLSGLEWERFWSEWDAWRTWARARTQERHDRALEAAEREFEHEDRPER